MYSYKLVPKWLGMPRYLTIIISLIDKYYYIDVPTWQITEKTITILTNWTIKCLETTHVILL